MNGKNPNPRNMCKIINNIFVAKNVQKEFEIFMIQFQILVLKNHKFWTAAMPPYMVSLQRNKCILFGIFFLWNYLFCYDNTFTGVWYEYTFILVCDVSNSNSFLNDCDCSIMEAIIHSSYKTKQYITVRRRTTFC